MEQRRATTRNWSHLAQGTRQRSESLTIERMDLSTQLHLENRPLVPARSGLSEARQRRSTGRLHWPVATTGAIRDFLAVAPYRMLYICPYLSRNIKCRSECKKLQTQMCCVVPISGCLISETAKDCGVARRVGPTDSYSYCINFHRQQLYTRYATSKMLYVARPLSDIL